MVALPDFRLLQWCRLRYKYCVMFRHVDWQWVLDVSKKSTASSGSAVQEESFLDCLTTILRNLGNYLQDNTAYYSRRIKSLTSMAAGCFETSNRRRTEDINKCDSLKVCLFHTALLLRLLKISSVRKADSESNSTCSTRPRPTVLLTTTVFCS